MLAEKVLTECNVSSLMADEPLYGIVSREPDLRRKSERKTYEIKQLWQRTHEIINLAATGLKQDEIAEVLGITPQTVSNTLNSRLGLEKLSDLRGDRDLRAKLTVEKVRLLTERALEVYNEIFEDDSGKSTLKDKKAVADTVLLELSGLRTPTKIQSQSVHTVLSKEEIREFTRRGIESAKEAGLVIEVEDEEENEIL